MKALPGLRLPRYRDALLKHLRLGADADISAAIGLGSGLSALKLVQAHEQILAEVMARMPSGKERLKAKQHAVLFLAAAMVPRRRAGSGGGDARRVAELVLKGDPLSKQVTTSMQAQDRDNGARKAAERALKSCRERYRKLREKSERLGVAQREVYRRMLLAQEDERKELSRELHDVMAQSLTSINLQLASLKATAERSAKSLDQSIALTQKLVAESVTFVQRFARELRPAMLDDLGLIAALKDLMNDITVRTGLRIRLAVCASVEELGMTRRTVLFRVAQEALTNITRHAKASKVEVKIRHLDDWFSMTIQDDGRAFSVRHALRNESRRLGLLCMRERLEMVGGCFGIESKRGLGTTVSAGIPATVATGTVVKLSAHRTPRAKP
ncbi:MAG: sensor histidine kinase [Planctomycetota bacterium]|nr:sensor histidine kinase [Planctomycetota bacterium]